MNLITKQLQKRSKHMQHKLLKLENKVHRGKPGQTPTEQHQENMKYFAKGVPVEMTLKEIHELPFYISEHKGVNTGYVFGEVENNHRNDKNMINRDLFVIDLDDVPGDIFDELVQGLKTKGVNAVVHTSFSHKLEGKGSRFRVIMETSNTMTIPDYPTALENMIEDTPVLKKYKEYIDDVSSNKSQFYFAPSHPTGMEEFARKEYINGGMPLIPDTRKRVVDNISSSNVETVKTPMSELMVGVDEGYRYDACLRLSGLLLSKGIHAEDTISLILGWNQLNRPPMDKEKAVGVIRSLESQYYFPTEDKNIETPKLLSMKDIMNLPDILWLVYGLLVQEGMSMIFGKSGDTKSFLALHLALCLAHKINFFNISSDYDHKIPVVYNALEGVYGLKNRIDGWHKAHGLPFVDNFYGQHNDLFLNDNKSVDRFIDLLKSIDFKKGLIIIDTYNNATPGIEENASGQYGLVNANIKRITRTFKSHVLVVHHTGKDGEDYRGTSAMGGAMDTIIKVTKTADNYAQWNVVKSKESEVGLTMKYKLHIKDLGLNSKGKSKSTLTIEELGVTKMKGERQKLGAKQQFVYDLIKERIRSYTEGDVYIDVKKDVCYQMGDRVEQNRKGNLFDTQVMVLTNKKMLKVDVSYPEQIQRIQLTES
jgi:hypothetical protein